MTPTLSLSRETENEERGLHALSLFSLPLFEEAFFQRADVRPSPARPSKEKKERKGISGREESAERESEKLVFIFPELGFCFFCLLGRSPHPPSPRALFFAAPVSIGRHQPRKCCREELGGLEKKRFGTEKQDRCRFTFLKRDLDRIACAPSVAS